MSETDAKRKSDVYEIDLIAIFAIFWRQRKLILFGTLAVTLLAAAVSFFIPKTYRSDGFYQLGNPEKQVRKNKNDNKEDKEDKEDKKDKEALLEKKKDFIGLPITLYNKRAPQFYNPDQLQFFVSQEKLFGEKDLKEIKSRFQTAAAIEEWIKPWYAFSKENLREFVQVSKDESNSVLGLKLSYEANSPQKAYNYVYFFSRYVQDCLLYVSLFDYIKEEYSMVISKLSENENDIIDLEYKLLGDTKKMLDIKAILTKYPEAAKIENRQLVSVQDEGFRFLAPVTQLVGIESALADLRRDLAELEWDKEKLVMRREYFSKCNDALNKLDRRGKIIFSQLESIKFEVFKNKDFRKGTVKEAVNDLSIDLQVFDLAFFTNCRFITGPTLPLRHIKPRKSIIVVLTCFVSFFFFIFLTLVLHWWQSNKKRIKSFR